MSYTEALPQPTRSLGEWLTATSIAPVASRWRALAWLPTNFPVLALQANGRIYQLPFLDEQQEGAFIQAFVAGKAASSRLLGRLLEGEDALGYTVLSELVGVYLLRLVGGRWVLLLRQTRTGVTRVLPVPNRRLLLLLLLSRKTILR